MVQVGQFKDKIFGHDCEQWLIVVVPWPRVRVTSTYTDIRGENMDDSKLLTCICKFLCMCLRVNIRV